MAESATIPWQCWEAAGFKTCHSNEWQKARDLCITAWPTISHQYGEHGGDLNLCINQNATIRALQNCGTLCPQAAPIPDAQKPLDPTAVDIPTRLEVPDAVKIMGVAAVAGILVWLVMRRKK